MQIRNANNDLGFVGDLEAALLSDLRAGAVQGVNCQINLALRDDSGALVAGLSGATSYGWLRINMIWVSDAARRCGLGRQLMQQAIDEARGCGCHSVWLETSNPQACTFYQRLGFEVFATLTNSDHTPPECHSRWFLKHVITAPTTE